MNKITVARKRISGIARTIDEVEFQANILKLNAALEAAGGQRPQTPWSVEAATETLALIEESIAHSPGSCETKPTDADRELVLERMRSPGWRNNSSAPSTPRQLRQPSSRLASRGECVSAG
jgi:hypothetical protein